MISYVGMKMVLKEQGQDDYFSQQSIPLTFIVSLLTILLIVRRLVLAGNVKSMNVKAGVKV